MSRADRGSVAAATQVPAELDALALRLGWAAGKQARGQIRILLAHTPAFVLRRVLLDVLSRDPCLVQSRRSALAILNADREMAGSG